MHKGRLVKVMLPMTILVSSFCIAKGNLRDTLSTLGWRRVLVTSPTTDQGHGLARGWVREGVHVAQIGDPCQVTNRSNSTMDGEVTDLRAFDETLLQRSVQCGMPQPFRRLLIITRDALLKVETYLESQQMSIGILSLIVPEMRLVRIIKMSLSEKTVVMDYSPAKFDFKKMKLVCYSLPYPPVIDFDCGEMHGEVCGMYPRIISHLGNKFNFTVAYHRDPSGKWGNTKDLGQNEASVMKSLHSGVSAFSFSWIGTYDRVMLFDHTLGITLNLDMYMMESGPKLSMGMVFKPFTVSSWLHLATFVGAVTLLHKSSLQFNSFLGLSVGIKYLVTIVMGLFVTVIIAFYRSAMVIALTTKPPIPFDNLISGLAQPDWDLVYTRGSEGLYQDYYKSIPEAKEKRDAVLDPTYKYASEDTVQKYQHLANAKTFLIEDRDRAAYFLRHTNCQVCKDAFRFGRPETKNSGFLFEKHSPLKEAFKIGLVQMRETGMLDHIKQSLGPEYKPLSHNTAAPLTIQLMVLVFIFLASVATVLCPFILGAEHIWKRLANDSTSDGKNRLCDGSYEEGLCFHCGHKRIRQTICVR